MALNKRQKILLYTVVGLIVTTSLAIIVINIIVGNIIETKIKNSLNTTKNTNYTIELRKVNANILSGNINLKDLKIIPDSSFIEQIKNGESEKSQAIDLNVETFRVAGIGIFKAISEKNIHIDKILFKKAKLKMYLGKKSEEQKEKPDSAIALDSIYIKGMDAILIGGIEFIKCQVEIYDLEKEQLILSSNDLEVELDEIALKELDGNNDYFKLYYKNIAITLEEEKLTLQGGNYYLTLGRFHLDLSDSILEAENLIVKPTYEDKYELAKKLRFTSEIFDVTVAKISILGIDIDKLIENGQFFIDSIKVDGLDLNILMDKRLPFNVDKRPKLPNELLKGMGIPIYIHHIDIENSRLNYQERMPNTTDLMTAILGDLDVQITFATSRKDSLATGKSMVINLRSQFMDLTPLMIDFDFPLNNQVDTFYYSGHLSSAKMNEFNQASFPAMGVKFTQGDLKEISFSGSANPEYSAGEMTMLYVGLEAEVSKKDYENKNKFLSWVANSVVHTANPGKNNTVRVAKMQFERVPYKGFGNLMWKTLQSGIVNSVLPTGKTINNSDKKESRKERKKQRKDKQ